jgi:hypothetical protein
MELKRTTEIFVETKRRFVVERAETAEQFFCADCAEPMLAAEETAGLFGVSRRRVYQLIETGTAHFAETETGVVMLCLSSLAARLGSGAGQLIDASAKEL